MNTLVGYLGNATELTLPGDYKGENYAIGAAVFQNYTGLAAELIIPNSVTSIGSNAFYGCTGLTSITIPNSVTSIGNEAFRDCRELKEVHISDLTAWCGIDFASANANPLYYASNLYLNGDLLTEIVIPEGVAEIKHFAFYRCTGLTSITIPYSVTSIGNYAFYGCTGLTSITIPNSVTSIGASAFEGCNNIEKLYIGSSVESIGDKAFTGCEKITEIKVALEKPIRGSADIFADAVYDNATLYIPNGTEQLYQKREPWNLFFYIAEMDFTGIDEVKGENGEVKTIYDLQGRKVEVPSEGLYIIDGKKVVVK